MREFIYNAFKSLDEMNQEEEKLKPENTKVLNNLRKDIQGEIDAIIDYDERAEIAEEAGYTDLANTMRDIRDEEKVHVGELEHELNKLDPHNEKLVDEGKEEAEEHSLEEDLDKKYRHVLKKALTQLRKPDTFAVVIGIDQGKGVNYLDKPLVKKSLKELQQVEAAYRRGKEGTKVVVKTLYPKDVESVEDLLKENLKEDLLVNSGKNKGLIIRDDCVLVGTEIELEIKDLGYEASVEVGGDIIPDHEPMWAPIHYSPERTIFGTVEEWTWDHELSKDDIKYFLDTTDNVYTQEDLDSDDCDKIYDDMNEDLDFLEDLAERNSDEAEREIEHLSRIGDLDPDCIKEYDYEPDYEKDEPEDYRECLKEGYVKRDELGATYCSLDGSDWEECSEEEFNEYLEGGYIDLTESLKVKLNENSCKYKLNKVHEKLKNRKEKLFELAEAKGFDKDLVNMLVSSKLKDSNYSENDAFGYVESLMESKEDFDHDIIELNEKLPKDIAKAYREYRDKDNTPKSVDSSDYHKIHGNINLRRGATIDFDKASYKKISKEEALDLIKKNASQDRNYNLNHMIFIYKIHDRVIGMIKFDENGNQISKMNRYEFTYTKKSGEEISNSYFWPLKTIIELATDIYWTDEPEMLIDRSQKENPKFNKEIADLYYKPQNSYYSTERPFKDIDDNGELRVMSDDPTTQHSLEQQYSTKDTGNHNISKGWDQQRYLEAEKDLRKYMKRYPNDELGRKEIYIDRLNDARKYYLKSIQSKYYNSDDFKYLKNLSQNKLNQLRVFKQFLSQISNKIDSIKDETSWRNNYGRALSHIKDLEARIERLKEQIKETEASIEEYKNSYTEEDKKDYELTLNDQFNDLADKAEDIEAKMNKLLRKVEVNESLESNIKYRIYLVTESGTESFKDNNWTNISEVIEDAKNYSADDYSRVCVVELDLRDPDDIKIVWDSLEDTNLNEDLSINKKDELQKALDLNFNHNYDYDDFVDFKVREEDGYLKVYDANEEYDYELAEELTGTTHALETIIKDIFGEDAYIEWENSVIMTIVGSEKMNESYTDYKRTEDTKESIRKLTNEVHSIVNDFNKLSKPTKKDVKELSLKLSSYLKKIKDLDVLTKYEDGGQGLKELKSFINIWMTMILKDFKSYPGNENIDLDKIKAEYDLYEDFEETSNWDKLSYDSKAWLLNKIISSMNDEGAYYSGWLYIWPDGESREECKYDFADKESYHDLEDSFKYHYKDCHEGGLYNPSNDTIAAAKYWDKKLGLEPIDIIKNTNESLHEGKQFNIKDDKEMVDAKMYAGLEPEKEDELIAVDPNAESEDENLRAKVGDALLECKTCKGIRTMHIDDLDKDADSDTYNKGDICPHCGSKDGYNYIAQLASPEVKTTEEDVEEVTEPEVEDSEIVEQDDESAVIESLDFNTFDAVIKNHLNEVFSNVEDYKSINLINNNENIIVEGLIKSKNGKSIKSQFIFDNASIIADNNIILEGYNKLLSEDKNALKLAGKIQNKELISESLSYKYNVQNKGELYKVSDK